MVLSGSLSFALLALELVQNVRQDTDNLPANFAASDSSLLSGGQTRHTDNVTLKPLISEL